MDNGKLSIVTLPVSDWQEYKELRLKALRKEPHAFCSTYKKEEAWNDEKWQKRLKDVVDGKSWMFFARSGEKLVGMIGVFCDEEDGSSNRVYLWGMYVDKVYRSRGVARALALRIFRELDKVEGVDFVQLGVNEDLVVARGLYESLGFRKLQTASFVFGDGLSHVVLIMEKLLHQPV